MPEVRLNQVRKRYENGVLAVDDFTLAVADGEFVVLVGPSGSGKSTTLRLIAGLEEITSGEIYIGDRLVNRLHPKDRDIAMVFQDYALYPHMTVAGNLSFGLKLRRVPKAEIARRVADAARLLSISDLLERKPSALSGGQRQRVALGRAIVRDPAAFLFDEPLSNLDAKLRLTTRAEIKSLHRRLSATTIYVTHDQEEAMSLADRVVVMCDGRIQQIGKPLSVYQHPVNRFVASFMGSPSMNFIDGRLARIDGRLTFLEDGAADTESGLAITLPPGFPESLTSLLDKSMVLGFRPQALGELSSDDGGADIVTMRIDVVESLGEAIDLHGTTVGAQPLIARLKANAPVPTTGKCRLKLQTERLHLFEPGPFSPDVLLR